MKQTKVRPAENPQLNWKNTLHLIYNFYSFYVFFVKSDFQKVFYISYFICQKYFLFDVFKLIFTSRNLIYKF